MIAWHQYKMYWCLCFSLDYFTDADEEAFCSLILLGFSAECNIARYHDEYSRGFRKFRKQAGCNFPSSRENWVLITANMDITQMQHNYGHFYFLSIFR